MWFELLKDFFFDLNANRVRAALTLAAITWGTVAVVLLLSFGDGLGTQMMNGLLNAGDRILIVYGGETGLAHEGLPKGRRIRLLEEDVELLDRIVPAIDMISPQYRKNITGGVAALDLNIGRRLLRAARRR
ncbi:MAG: ABC transporter permease [Bacteroidota bacterium]